MAHRLADHDIAWFEEPVSSMDLSGRWLRERVPPGMQIAAGEYGSDIFEFRAMCEEEAADVIRPDPIRCRGFTGFLRAAACAVSTPISAQPRRTPAPVNHATRPDLSTPQKEQAAAPHRVHP